MTRNSKLEALSDALDGKLADAIAARHLEFDELTIDVDPARIVAVCRVLKDAPEFAFKQLSDLSAVDYLSYGFADWQTYHATTAGFSRGVEPRSIQVTDGGARKRFGLSYQLLSLEHNVRLRVKAYLDGEPPRIESVTDVWPVADWYEREAFDLFGILFDGHPDLRRILTDYGFIGHPFRKDFPLEGKVEVRYDPDRGRVIYQPVTIESRTLVPRVIREDWVHSSKPVSTADDA